MAKIKPKAIPKTKVAKKVAVELSDIKKKKKGTKLSVDAPINTNRYPLAGQNADLVRDENLADFSRRALSIYGSYVVEERAIPDFRDGLKPVHRAIVWSLSDLNLRYGGAAKKSMRVVGDALGKYHPHGDKACYDAMVTIANTVPPAVHGDGNWGTPVDNAAAPRYTEAKMSKFTEMFLLDSDYLAVTEMVPNYSNDGFLPLHLPALLPYMLFNGSIPAPAYGVKCGNPTFGFKSVSKVVIDMLAGKKYDHAKLASTLEVIHEYGCKTISSDEEFFQLVSTGRGKVTYEPIMNPDFKTKIIHVQSFVPNGFSSEEGIEKTLVALGAIAGVKVALSNCGKKNPNAGLYGAAFEINCKGSSDDRFAEIAREVQKKLTKSPTYMLGVSVRHAKRANAFMYLDYLKFFKAWCAYRIKLEIRMLDFKIAKAEKEKHILDVYLFAIDNMKKLLAALPKVLAASDPDKVLAKALGLPIEDAKIILDRQVRKLAKLEREDIVAKINVIKANIKDWKNGLKNPGLYASNDTDLRVKKYLKSPDINIQTPL